MKILPRMQAIGVGLCLTVGLIIANTVLISWVLTVLEPTSDLMKIMVTGLIISVVTYVFTGLAKRTGIFD